jgi:hypothetical protein
VVIGTVVGEALTGRIGICLFRFKTKSDPKVAFRLPGYEDLPNDLEISPAAVVHPDTAAIIAPAAALPAGSVAALFQ